MKRHIAVLLLISLLFIACAQPNPSEKELSAISGASSDTENHSQTKQPEPVVPSSLHGESVLISDASLVEGSLSQPKQPESPLPKPVQAMLFESLEGARLLTISPEGKELSRISFTGKDYSDGQLSSDGRFLLCKTDAESGGEGRICGYSLIDLETGKEASFSGLQNGFQRHMLLDYNLIGHTTSGSIGGVLQPKNGVSFYDFSYNLLEMTLPYNQGKPIPSYGASNETYPEITATGLGYDQETERFYLTLAKDLSHLEGAHWPDLPYSESQFGIALFTREGEQLKTMWFGGYQAPFSYNVLCLIDKPPLILPDGRLLLSVQNPEQDQYNQPPLLFDPQTLAYEEVAALAYGYQPASRDGRYLRVNDDGNDPVHLMRLTDGGDFETVRSWIAKNAPHQILTNGEQTYLVKNIWSSECSYDELLYFDGESETKILMLPNYWYSILGIDREGNLLLLLDGASKEGQTRETMLFELGLL